MFFDKVKEVVNQLSNSLIQLKERRSFLLDQEGETAPAEICRVDAEMEALNGVLAVVQTLMQFEQYPYGCGQRLAIAWLDDEIETRETQQKGLLMQVLLQLQHAQLQEQLQEQLELQQQEQDLQLQQQEQDLQLQQEQDLQLQQEQEQDLQLQKEQEQEQEQDLQLQLQLQLQREDLQQERVDEVLLNSLSEQVVWLGWISNSNSNANSSIC